MYSGVAGALLLPLFCWQCMCVVCTREMEGRLKGLCLLFYELSLYVGFLRVHALLRVPETATSVIPMLAHTRGPGALRPSSIGLSQIQQDTGGPESVPARDMNL